METHPARREDAKAIHQLYRRWETFWDAPLVTPLQEIEEDLDAPSIDIETDTICFWEDDELRAYGRIWHREGGETHERAYAFGLVDPDHRRRGIGRRLMSWQVERGSEILNSIDNDLPKYLRADEFDWIEESHRMYRRFGLQPVRYFTEMVRTLEEPVEVTGPPGIEIIPWDRELDRAALEVINTSFRDHWGSTPTDYAAFQYRLDGVGTRVDLSFLAMDGSDVVGAVLNSHYPEDEELLGRRDGWVETLGVLKEWRRKGLATALLNRSFNAFSDAGMTHSAIGVDTESPTDAFRLYTNLGYEPHHRSITNESRVDRRAEKSSSRG